MKQFCWNLQGCCTLRNIPDGMQFDVAMATCSVPVSYPSKWNITICDSTRQNTWSYLRHMPVPPSLGLLLNIFNCIFCPVQLQMVIVYFKEEGTGTEHVAIATSKCVPSGIFLRVQHSCQASRALLHYWQRYPFCVTPLSLHNRWCHQWLNLHNRKTWISLERKKISQKNAILLYSEKPFKLA